MPQTKQSSSSLLTEIRENYTYFVEGWREIREEAKTDMRYVSGDPWDQREKDARNQKGSERPCMTWDELSPYINQLVNEPRQNKRAIKITPKGFGATDKTAELRENKIREIQYNSRAQSAFTTAFQGAAERSYGYFRVGARLVCENLSEQQYDALAKTDPGKLFEQELYIGRIPNPDSVLYNFNYKEQDCSDSTECYVTDLIQRDRFEDRYPDATVTDFDSDHMTLAPQWIKDKEVMIAEYWKVRIKKKKLLLVRADEGDSAMYDDELPKGWAELKGNSERIKRHRTVEVRSVCQYITNGIEILDETEIPIPWIPIIPVFGKEIFVDKGSGARRMLISLVRMARDPFMSYCFYRSQEAEEAGMTPKSPLMMYDGQDEGQEDVLASINKVPRGYVTVKAKTEATGDQILPLPTRLPFTPNFQAYEVACEAARRAIQVAMGGSALPTAALRRNEKSGKALEEIDKQENQGTFHFIDNYNFSMEHAGRVIDAWFPYVNDTKRDMAIHEADGTQRSIRINDPDFEEKDENGQPVKTHYDAKTGEHSVTISVGPNSDSQRDEASAFVDTITANLQAIAAMVPPGAAAKILALSIRLKQLGPIGDEMAKVIDPPANQQAQQQAIQQGQMKLQEQQEIIVKMQQELEKLKLEKAGKVIDNQFKDKREAAATASEERLAQLDRDIQVLKALLASKQNISDQEYETFRTVWQENHGAAHDRGMQAEQHGHEKDQAAAAAQNAATTQQSDQSHQSAMAEQASSTSEEGAQP